MGAAASLFRKKRVHDEKNALVECNGNKVAPTPITPVVPSVPTSPSSPIPESQGSTHLKSLQKDIVSNDENTQVECGLIIHEPKKRPKNLINAAKSGDLEAVKELIALRRSQADNQSLPAEEDLWEVDLNARGMWSNTPLILACQYGHAEIAALLLEAGADFQLENEKGARALLYCCIEGLTEVVTTLLSKKDVVDPEPVHIYNPKTDCSQRLTPLLAASINGYNGIVEKLLDAGASVNRGTIFKIKRGDEFEETFSEKMGVTPLAGAAKQNHIDTVKLLLDRGAELSPEDEDGTDPFFEACKDGRTEMAAVLLEMGSTAEAKKTMACRRSSTKAKNASPLHLACQNRSEDLVPLLLAAGAEVDCVDSRQATPLLYAVQMGLENAVRALLEAGSNPTLADKHGRTPLKLAQKSRNREAIVGLLESWISKRESPTKSEDPQCLAVEASREVAQTPNQRCLQLAEEDAILKDVEGLIDGNFGQPGIKNTNDQVSTAPCSKQVESEIELNTKDEEYVEGSIADNLDLLNHSGLVLDDIEENHELAPEIIVVPSPRSDEENAAQIGSKKQAADRRLSLVHAGATKVYKRVSLSVSLDIDEPTAEGNLLEESMQTVLQNGNSLLSKYMPDSKINNISAATNDEVESRSVELVS
mmetsp:Transcript_38851/g.51192  ORF Transcript_38851/g.51192 Transcript_38851/m.51192 type:complete len:648 (+) Transcript_38851:379-2322(+)